MKIRNIGIITSGGDCGGLNAVIKGAAQMCNSKKIGCFVIPNGYAGLYNLVEFEKLTKLTLSRIDSIEVYLAGSEAGHSRVKIGKIEDKQKYNRIKQGLKKFNIDGLVISGGDDTGSVMVDLVKRKIRCVHVPKTMDLDLQTYSVGGDSAINRIASYAQEIKTTGRSHNRIIVLEVFGRYTGHTAFRGGVGADADAILIPEIPVDFDILYQHLKQRYIQRVKQSDVHAGTYLIVVAEGLKDASGKELVDESAPVDAFGHKKLAGAGKYVKQEIEKRLKSDPEIKEFMREVKMYVPKIYEIPEVRVVSPGHLIRSGFSSAYDVNFGREAGAAAVTLLLKGITGVTIVGVYQNQIRYTPTNQVIKTKPVDLRMVSLYENLGVCFGRKPKLAKFNLKKVAGKIDRILYS